MGSCGNIFPLSNQYFCSSIKSTTFAEAKTFCEQNGMNLYVPNVGNENRARIELRLAMNALAVEIWGLTYWIGGSKSSGSWSWVTGADPTLIPTLLCSTATNADDFGLLLANGGLSSRCLITRDVTTTQKIFCQKWL